MKGSREAPCLRTRAGVEAASLLEQRMSRILASAARRHRRGRQHRSTHPLGRQQALHHLQNGVSKEAVEGAPAAEGGKGGSPAGGRDVFLVPEPEHDSLCTACNDGGLLLCCDGCTSAFHRTADAVTVHATNTNKLTIAIISAKSPPPPTHTLARTFLQAARLPSTRTAQASPSHLPTSKIGSATCARAKSSARSRCASNLGKRSASSSGVVVQRLDSRLPHPAY
ncbi:hypothetical protein T492DRAFT_250044 [Pavlovales sp. CCMP2436]|nr:hypothetical protein T492DRAFT_250044 [Pavlovales sp. CCMP2436]